MFVNLWGGAIGRPLSYASVYDLVLRIRREVGFGFDPHWFRHTRATLLQVSGVALNAIFTRSGECLLPGAQRRGCIAVTGRLGVATRG
jgi:integrase/recombinase XerD